MNLSKWISRLWGTSAEQKEPGVHMHVRDNQGTVIGEQHVTVVDSQKEKEAKKAAAYRLYLDRLRGVCRQLPLGAVGAIQEEEVMTLDDVYIRLLTTETEQDKEGRNTQVSAMTCLERHPRLVLLGDPGSGKSTFVNQVLALYADACLEPSRNTPANLPKGRVPVRVILRDLAASMDKTYPEGVPDTFNAIEWAGILEQHAISALSRLGAEEFGQALTSAFKEHRVLLVLDGLDEVPGRQRADVRRVVREAATWYKLTHLVITCRIRSYEGEQADITRSTSVTLAPFNNEQKALFAKAWYKPDLRADLTPEEAQDKARDLTKAATSEELTEIAENPMLLTTMAIIHQRDTRLPDKRVELYEEAIQVMLWKWQTPKGRGGVTVSSELKNVLKDKRRILRSLMRLAYDAHSAAHTDKQTAGIAREQAYNILITKDHLGSHALAEEFLNYVDQRAGLLQGYGGSENEEHPLSYGFPHRTFQEYLAGRYIMSLDVGTELPKLAKEGAFWYEAVKSGLEDQVYLRTAERTLVKEAYLLKFPDFPQAPDQQRLVLWLGYITELVGADVIEGIDYEAQKGTDYLAEIKAYLVELLAGTLPPIERAEAGRILGCIGDPRKELTTLEHMTFCRVPAGPFRAGMNDGRKDTGEVPERTEDVPYDYWIATCTVTQAQYREFVDAGGYEERSFWTTAGWERKNKEPWVGPRLLKKDFMLDNHPVVGVSWYEAFAFTQWLQVYAAEQAWLPRGYTVDLPTELEWEKAARGGHHVPEPPVIHAWHQGFDTDPVPMVQNTNLGRQYPYGNAPDRDKMNHSATKVGRTTAPGCFSLGRSPYGAEDMSGNVWEWGRERWSKTPPGQSKERKPLVEPDGSSLRVLRGGSFVGFDFDCRCALRGGNFPYYRSGLRGFRLVVRPLSSESL